MIYKETLYFWKYINFKRNIYYIYFKEEQLFFNLNNSYSNVIINPYNKDVTK